LAATSKKITASRQAIVPAPSGTASTGAIN
jgi:hypothetical protein